MNTPTPNTPETPQTLLQVLTRIADSLDNISAGTCSVSNRLEDLGGWISSGLSDVANSRGEWK